MSPYKIAVSSPTSITAIKKMNVITIRNHLVTLGLNSKGHRDVLVKQSFTNTESDYARFINPQPTCNITEKNEITNKKNQQPYNYYICFDVEATCEKEGGFDYQNEIIEFPALLLDSNTFEIEITDVSPTFPEVLDKFQEFLHRHQLNNSKSFAFMTDGPWDIRDFIRKQCTISNISRPIYFKSPWVNIRKLYSDFYKIKKCNISTMLTRYELNFEGHEHSGIDDARNLAIIVKKMWEDGAIFIPNCYLDYRKTTRKKKCRNK
ncbi:8460_t:CDS:2 [Entrophospora sp. SA101]|nr:8460_t:CDS:2 [Entrophospora sp. SA101]